MMSHALVVTEGHISDGHGLVASPRSHCRSQDTCCYSPPPGRSLQRRFIVVGRLIHRMCQKDLVEVALVDKGVSVDRRDVNSLSMPTIKN
jgi:hypothetical protein